MDLRRSVLRGTRRLLGFGVYPGQYILTDHIGRRLAPSTGTVEGRVGGYAVELDLHDEIQRQVYFGIYDRLSTRLIGKLLRPGGVFYDVGANVGYFTMLAAGLVGPRGKVHAFEPVTENFGKITSNVARNALSHVELNQVAISDKPGTLTLFLPEVVKNSGWASIVPSKGRRRNLVVPTLALDDYVAAQGNERPDLIKIDIEGAEPHALRGMTSLLRDEPAPDILIEVNPILLKRIGHTPADILDPLIRAGYRLYLSTRRGLERFERGYEIEHLTDLYATKKPIEEATA